MIKTTAAFAQELRKLLDKRDTASNVIVCVQPKSMGTLCFHKNTIGMRLAQLLVLAKRGKDRHPLLDYDGELQLVLNRKRFFSSALGLQFSNQRKDMIECLVKGEDATMLTTNQYGLQKAGTPRSRVWTLNVKMSKKRTSVSVVFGHCTILPAVLYDIAAVDAVAHWFAHELSAPVQEITLFFHSLKGNGEPTMVEHKDGITKLPESAEIYELLRLEEAVRETKPSVAPVPNMPLPDQLDKLLHDVHDKWSKNGTKRKR